MLLTLTIIFGVGSVAGAFFFWRERKSRMIYQRSYNLQVKDYSELRHRTSQLMRETDAQSRRQKLILFVVVCFWIVALMIYRRLRH